MVHLHTLGAFLAKIEKINWSKVDKALGKRLSSEDGWELTYFVEELDSFHNEDFSLQVRIQLRFEGELVQGWGCEDNKDNAAFLKYFKTKRYAIQKELDKERRVSEQVGKEKFINL